MTACPYCASTKVYKPPFRWLDLLATVLLLGPYKCRVCRVRFLRFWWNR